ncbi:DUF2628 domain-containing protein [Terrisporobacter mayombei]|uniref:Putative zinc-ribbon domain-containing protein n=1 Tax=Terrisporobacter mayombei TaxID=1541 RepID=A0ABY9Q6X6_9FIRM|nr:DUF2628 domain-containing protein [Terrisporobacter mayombei]MCC3868754.1 DUF2628 domain-containing protein [Terrisporobacter mayombei]WMT83119.1 hypothetical protein TEMA_36170 [Terrisporobacter mayombei]
MAEENKFIYCSKCGKKSSKDTKFCTNCGNKLITIEDSIKNTTENIKDAIKNNETYKSFADTSYDENCRSDFDNRDMVNFIQKKEEYYIPKFKEIQELYKSTSWNWAAFFFNSWWFLYRKMYAIGFGLIIADVVIGLLIPSLSLIASIAIAVISGLYGNIAYLKYIQKQLISFTNMDDDIKQRLILDKGGVNIVIPIILSIITIGFLLLIGALGTFLFMFSSPYYY